MHREPHVKLTQNNKRLDLIRESAYGYYCQDVSFPSDLILVATLSYLKMRNEIKN